VISIECKQLQVKDRLTERHQYSNCRLQIGYKSTNVSKKAIFALYRQRINTPVAFVEIYMNRRTNLPPGMMPGKNIVMRTLHFHIPG
jgi:hypothetical protein